MPVGILEGSLCKCHQKCGVHAGFTAGKPSHVCQWSSSKHTIAHCMAFLPHIISFQVGIPESCQLLDVHCNLPINRCLE
jgi:hypothetical protein